MSELPAILTAVAAVIVAAGGVLGIIMHSTGPKHQPPASHDTTPKP